MRLGPELPIRPVCTSRGLPRARHKAFHGRLLSNQKADLMFVASDLVVGLHGDKDAGSSITGTVESMLIQRLVQGSLHGLGLKVVEPAHGTALSAV